MTNYLIRIITFFENLREFSSIQVIFQYTLSPRVPPGSSYLETLNQNRLIKISRSVIISNSNTRTLACIAYIILVWKKGVLWNHLTQVQILSPKYKLYYTPNAVMWSFKVIIWSWPMSHCSLDYLTSFKWTHLRAYILCTHTTYYVCTNNGVTL